ncbi:MAG: hypothetical protein K2X76_01790 [Sphingomonas sp.]|nr:hypothetical protein [Sphingomonas sp.]
MNNAPSRDSYYAVSQSWAEERDASARRSRTLAWTIASVAAGIALLEAVALAALAPLKTVEPYTLLVDRATGHTQVLRGAGTSEITPDSALTQSLLAQYVVARESFDITDIAYEYRKVALWSGPEARRDYAGKMQASNPLSPFNRLPRTSIVRTTVRSVSPLGQNAALVRFETERVDQGQDQGVPAYWVAVLRYRFVRAPASLEDRLINPLGFQVTHYRRDQEAPPAAPPTTASPAPLATPAAAVTAAPPVARPSSVQPSGAAQR